MKGSLVLQRGQIVRYPSILPGGPPYRTGADPEREKRLEWLSRDYAGSPWLTALVRFRGFLAVFIRAFAAVILLIIKVGSGDARWSYALSLAVLEAARSGLWMLRRHRQARSLSNCLRHQAT